MLTHFPEKIGLDLARRGGPRLLRTRTCVARVVHVDLVDRLGRSSLIRSVLLRPALRAGASEAGSSLSSAQRRAQAYKTKPCRYWTQKGTCARGEACGFIHEDAPEHPGGVEPATRTGVVALWNSDWGFPFRIPFAAIDSYHQRPDTNWLDLSELPPVTRSALPAPAPKARSSE